MPGAYLDYAAFPAVLGQSPCLNGGCRSLTHYHPGDRRRCCGHSLLQPRHLLALDRGIAGRTCNEIVVVGSGRVPPRTLQLVLYGLFRAAVLWQKGCTLGEAEQICDLMAAPLQRGPRRVEPHPVGIRVQLQHGKPIAMTIDQGQIVIDAGVQRPDARRRIVLPVVTIEEGYQMWDRAHEVAADGAAHIGGAAAGREPGYKFVDFTCDIVVRTIGQRRGEHIDAGHSAIGQKVPLRVGEGVPVAQNLASVRPAPDENQRALFVQQHVGAGAGTREMPGKLYIRAWEKHAVDARDSCHIEAGGPEQ